MSPEARRTVRENRQICVITQPDFARLFALNQLFEKIEHLGDQERLSTGKMQVLHLRGIFLENGPELGRGKPIELAQFFKICVLRADLMKFRKLLNQGLARLRRTHPASQVAEIAQPEVKREKRLGRLALRCCRRDQGCDTVRVFQIDDLSMASDSRVLDNVPTIAWLGPLAVQHATA